MTAIVRTMQENFQPISQIRFLIDSKPPKTNPNSSIDLSKAWQIPNAKKENAK